MKEVIQVSKAKAPIISQGGAASGKLRSKTLGRRILDNWQMYALLLIPVVLTIVYKYIPMYGIQIAFRDFTPSQGFTESTWVGLKWFQQFFSSVFSKRLIRNTILLNLY